MSVCPRCGRENKCGFGQAQPCWCVSMGGERLPVPTGQDAACYCPACLAELTGSSPPQAPLTEGDAAAEP